MRARLIANPSSGTDRAPVLLPLIRERLATFVDHLEITITTGEPDVERAAARAVEEHCDLLFVAGGDGTLNIAVSTVAAIDGGLERIVFGIIPAGTGNDFAKALDLGEVAEAALDRLVERRIIDTDLGLVNERAFLNVSAGGFVADVTALLTEPLKDVTGKLAFVIGGARALFGREPFATDIQSPGSHAGSMDLQMFAVCNARFIGGGHPIAPHALIDDGLLDVVLVRRTTTLEFVALLQKIAAGEHAGDERIVILRAPGLDLVFDRVINVNADGQLLAAERCQYRLLRRAARFLCGPRPHASASPRPLVV